MSTSLEGQKASVILETTQMNEGNEALDGYILDPRHYVGDVSRLKTSSDGFILIPQPLDTDDDPLNWSPRKKWVILAIVAYIAGQADYMGGSAIITVIPQTFEWHLTQVAAQRAVVGNLFTLGACGLIVVALASFFGRLPILFLFQCVTVGTCVWSAAATTFDSYLAARIINGFFCSVGQGGALMWVKDLFFFHEHPRVINYIEFSIILSPYLGPLIACFIISGTTWRWVFWVCTILAGIGWFLVFFVDETLFDRSAPAIPQGNYFGRLVGIQQARGWKHRSFLGSISRPLVAVTKIPVLVILVYYFLNFAWVIGVNTTVAIWLTNIYGFTPRDLGYFYFFGVVGVILGWLAGHYLHDAVGRYYLRRHAGRLDPEARLIITYPATLILCLSLLILGFALQNEWHFMVLAVFAATQCFGVMIVTTAINAYLLDCYPEASGEVCAWIAASRNWAGFMATYIQIEWVTRLGLAKVFGIQAGITFASIFLIVLLQVYGKRTRKWQGRILFGSGNKSS
ncbi:MAG: hypothetical protein Q9220_007557 [cf. Caloplaca sp. 1 TL-2023]